MGKAVRRFSLNMDHWTMLMVVGRRILRFSGTGVS
jgi:hypothetical protein